MVWLFCSPFSIATLAPTQSGFSEKYEHDDNEPQWLEGTPLPMCRLLRFILRSHGTCPYDELRITRLARFCAGHVAPQSTRCLPEYRPSRGFSPPNLTPSYSASATGSHTARHAGPWSSCTALKAAASLTICVALPRKPIVRDSMSSG
jgi:hypothetical protein